MPVPGGRASGEGCPLCTAGPWPSAWLPVPSPARASVVLLSVHMVEMRDVVTCSGPHPCTGAPGPIGCAGPRLCGPPPCPLCQLEGRRLHLSHTPATFRPTLSRVPATWVLALGASVPPARYQGPVASHGRPMSPRWMGVTGTGPSAGAQRRRVCGGAACPGVSLRLQVGQVHLAATGTTGRASPGSAVRTHLCALEIPGKWRRRVWAHLTLARRQEGLAGLR